MASDSKFATNGQRLANGAELDQRLEELLERHRGRTGSSVSTQLVYRQVRCEMSHKLEQRRVPLT